MKRTPSQPPANDEQANAATADYDSWYSALISFVFHFCLMLLVSLFSDVIRARDKLPPAIDVVQVTDASTSGSAMDDSASPGEALESTTADSAADVPLTSTPVEQLNTVQPVQPQAIDVSTDDVQEEVRQEVGRARQAAAAAQAAAARLNENLGGSPGTPSGTGKGRAGRAARWVLRFNTSNSRDHLAQLGGLQANIAFPDRGDKYRFFSNLSGSPTSELRDLSEENRIFWIDEDPSSYHGLARELGVAPPPMMIAFLPVPLEEKMLKMELGRAREQGVTSEDGIAQTVFECVRRGGSYDVVIVDQTLADR